MTNPCVPFAAEALGRLRGAAYEAVLENDKHIVPDIYPAWDSTNADVTLTGTSLVGQLLAIDAVVKGRPQWFSLNINLGPGRFSTGDVIGFVMETGAGAPMTLNLHILSSQDGKLSQTGLPEKLDLSGDPQVVTSLHTLGPHDPIIASQTYHTLVINLPAHDFRLDLRAMRFFVVDAAFGLRSAPEP